MVGLFGNNLNGRSNGSNSQQKSVLTAVIESLLKMEMDNAKEKNQNCNENAKKRGGGMVGHLAILAMIGHRQRQRFLLKTICPVI